jgi:unsaturated rhamnogalacturonyl hydrolase
MFLNLLQLPSNDPTYRTLVATLKRQVDGLLPLQDAETGMWHTLLNDPSTYVESSATAGFVGGMLMAIRSVRLTGGQR